MKDLPETITTSILYPTDPFQSPISHLGCKAFKNMKMFGLGTSRLNYLKVVIDHQEVAEIRSRIKTRLTRLE
ncbi:hypothetical protein RIR_jg40822.t1 [Rhizophagus irregularis DAOM 181602=DAOM 197198]|uniref:Uncharacterized protein n=1 Tax=Rhizophagus irregularis (strain DAOM 181602 / DAOM 197198 / MUCL 43194) TaxID=747089 RepID=U9V207_RHIID|nr:hypothetical protein RIR_jg40822.t1 [Rhizophagus irregularis DAOM 181602=DAOM 197198]